MSLKERIHKLEKEIIEIKQKFNEPIVDLILKKIYQIEASNNKPSVLILTTDSSYELAQEVGSIRTAYECRRFNRFNGLKVILNDDIDERFVIGIE